MERTRTNKTLFALVGLAVMVMLGVYGFGRAIARPKSQPPATKKIDLAVTLVAQVRPELAIAFEHSVLDETIVPFLKGHGYEIGAVYSMTEVIIANGTPYRALLNAMNNKPDKDESRFLSITIVAAPGNPGETLVTGFALMDHYIHDMDRARTLRVSPKQRLLWTYEDTPVELSPEGSLHSLKNRITTGLKAYDVQFQEKLRTQDYPDLKKQ